MSRQNSSGLVEIGQRIHQARKDRSLTLDQLAERTGLSKGLLSKIENFRTIPSLPVLAIIAQNLGLDMAELVRGVVAEAEAPYRLVRADERKAVPRDDAEGFVYETTISRQLGGCYFDSQVLTVKPKAVRRAVTTDAVQFIFILAGELNFHLGGEDIAMREGDALLFDGRIPHVPVNNSGKEAKLLAIYLLKSGE